MSAQNRSPSPNESDDDGRPGPFAIVPKYDCPHLSDQVYVLLQSADTPSDEQPPCSDCGKKVENWICLDGSCAFIGCSRYQDKHMLNHHSTTGHKICFSFSDHSVFCYACDSYIDSPQLRDLTRQFRRQIR